MARERTARYAKKTQVIDVADLKEEIKDVKKQSLNIFCLGILTKILSDVLKSDAIKKIMAGKLSAKSGWEENLKAFELGFSTQHAGMKDF